LKIQLRSAEKKDWDVILTLRNKFFTNFYNQDKPLKKDEHYQYLEKQKTNPKFNHWMIVNESDILGYVRILDNDIGIMIKEEYQGKGIASQALEIAEEYAREMGIKKLVALVKFGNDSSKKIFLKNNYDLKMYWLEKQIQ